MGSGSSTSSKVQKVNVTNAKEGGIGEEKLGENKWKSVMMKMKRQKIIESMNSSTKPNGIKKHERLNKELDDQFELETNGEKVTESDAVDEQTEILILEEEISKKQAALTDKLKHFNSSLKNESEILKTQSDKVSEFQKQKASNMEKIKALALRRKEGEDPQKLIPELQQLKATHKKMEKKIEESTNNLKICEDSQFKIQINIEQCLEEKEELERQRQSATETVKERQSLRQELIETTKKRSTEGLRSVISRVDGSIHENRLKKDLAQAKKTLESLENIDNLRESVLQVESKAVSEVRAYREPPAVVHSVLIATLLILGEHEEKTQEWKNCQKYCQPIGPDNLTKRVQKYDPFTLHPEIAARVKKILKDYKSEDAKAVSQMAFTYYNWANGLAKEILWLHGKNFTAADKTKQKEIFAAKLLKEKVMLKKKQ